MSTIYLAETEIAGSRFVKTGWTSQNPQKRIAQLQTGCPTRIKLAATRPGSRAVEETIHLNLQKFRTNGGTEWFHRSSEVDSFISRSFAIAKK